MKILPFDSSILVIIGPSGAGKTRLIRDLLQMDLVSLTPSWTTRPPRSDELHDADHIFVSPNEFETRKKAGYFLETATLFGMPYSYGLPKILAPEKPAVPTILLRSMVLPLLRNHYPNAVVYALEADSSTLRNRMESRGEFKESMDKRILFAEQEVQDGRKIATRIFNSTQDYDLLLAEITECIREDFKSYLN